MLVLSLFLYTFGLIITLGSAVMAALNDLRVFKIPNYLSLLALFGFAAAYAGLVLLPGDSYPLLGSWQSHVASGAAMFVITLILFVTGSIGAGDAKFASALAVWTGIAALPAFVFCMTLIGGLMGIYTLILKRLKPFSSPREGGWIASAQAGQNKIPYGLAIAAGFFIACALSGFFNITEIINSVENSR